MSLRKRLPAPQSDNLNSLYYPTGEVVTLGMEKEIDEVVRKLVKNTK